jgi:hypothetical protein
MKAIAQSAKSAFHHDPPSFFSPCTSGSAMRQVAEVLFKEGLPFRISAKLKMTRQGLAILCKIAHTCRKVSAPTQRRPTRWLYISAKVSNADQLCSRRMSDHER